MDVFANQKIYFREEQAYKSRMTTFSFWLVLIFPFVYYTIIQVAFNEPIFNGKKMMALVPLLISFLISIRIIFLRLEVAITDTGIYYRKKFSMRKFKYIEKENIMSAEVKMWDYLDLVSTMTRKELKHCFRVKGSGGLLVKTREGRMFIGTQDLEKMQQAITKMVSKPIPKSPVRFYINS